MKVKTFRDKIENAGQHIIPLAGGDSDIGYRVHKLELMTTDPGNASQDLVLKIYSVKQTSVPSSSATIDFSEDDLIAAGYFAQATSDFSHRQTVVFDREIFNQDLYVTFTDNDGSDACNYYIELEEIKMSGGEQAVTNFRAALLHGE